MRKLTVDDIKDLREHEREREDLRREIIDLKKRRRVFLGDVVSIVFENSTTMRWQIQEMARVERMLRDEQIAHEVETYNELIPGDDELSGTLFLELTDDAALREWLPKLVGLQHRVAFVLPGGARVFGEPQDEERLTREETTAAVHFLRFRFSPEQVEELKAGPVDLAIDHAAYEARVTLSSETLAELVSDLEAP